MWSRGYSRVWTFSGYNDGVMPGRSLALCTHYVRFKKKSPVLMLTSSKSLMVVSLDTEGTQDFNVPSM